MSFQFGHWADMANYMRNECINYFINHFTNFFNTNNNYNFNLIPDANLPLNSPVQH